MKKKTASVVSLSIILYFLSIIANILLEPISDTGSTVAFLAIAGVATCILVYHFLTRPSYIKRDNSMVEEFKEWKAANTNRKKLVGSVISIVWTLTVIVYFIISFAFNNWHISWLIFIVSAAVSQIIKLIFDLKE